MKYLIFPIAILMHYSCYNDFKNDLVLLEMAETQLTFSPKTHALDNNNNFSSDGKYLCYDTRGTIHNENLANSKSIEKVEIETGEETVLWHPPSLTGENAAPGVAAVSYHPFNNKLIFIHGPHLEEINKRGYYNIRNRTAMEVDGNGDKTYVKVDMRDISNESTTPGAHRGGTHRHEYSRNGNRIGFTYDDFLAQEYDRTIGFMQRDDKTPVGYTHYFAVILKPIKKGKSKAGEIEKAYGDSWVNAEGGIRAFVGKVRAENRKDYETDLFIAEIPLKIDITTAFSGTYKQYPDPPKGIVIRRLTYGMNVEGIVRASMDGNYIAFAALDSSDKKQVYIIKSDGSDKKPHQLTNLDVSVSFIRWHPSGEWIFCISNRNIIATKLDKNRSIGTSIQLSIGDLDRSQLVVSHDGNLLSYVIPVPTKTDSGKLVKDANGNDFKQIFTMKLDWEKLNALGSPKTSVSQ